MNVGAKAQKTGINLGAVGSKCHLLPALDPSPGSKELRGTPEVCLGVAPFSFTQGVWVDVRDFEGLSGSSYQARMLVSFYTLIILSRCSIRGKGITQTTVCLA
ncbi:hypothetical protein ASPZODRAFT_979370 [Penicilliopsis zonata CBS 506.65]|uniref:Uncharacterized protein n=1 Tax=Penicilliopsis zonata CBS 506.65 TaxID=1073090 RepID=A0A1L9SR58_9EURO|nr:hypothetical protein ASPZODRAFT_979370 [Penicilliopsis zonata CBS 506.65]OJJ49594.1 hypothetical protein ASPZODRAFT_979370 [Penicilliopsis zonata CBS 506.65]